MRYKMSLSKEDLQLKIKQLKQKILFKIIMKNLGK